MDLTNTPFCNVRDCYRIPAVYPAETFQYSGVHACFLEGVPYHGRPTRFFAWWSLPAGASPENPVPGIVLVHGGGGTAFADWVSCGTGAAMRRLRWIPAAMCRAGS